MDYSIEKQVDQAVLQCLDRNFRMAYALGEIFEVKSSEGAYILEITPQAFRQRLSRARSRVREFMQKIAVLSMKKSPANATVWPRLPLKLAGLGRKNYCLQPMNKGFQQMILTNPASMSWMS